MQAYEKLEQEFAEWHGCYNTVACSSGTSALHLALESLDLPKGSQVLIPDFTMVACARACTLAGLIPRFVDCGYDLLMNPKCLDLADMRRVSAIMPVHIYGRVCNISAILEFARRYDLRVIEDCAEAHGANLSYPIDAQCWSFYQNKIIAGEEGGMIAFRRDKHARYAKLLRCQGFTPEHNFTHVPRGINARMSNAHARLVQKSLDEVAANLKSRRQVEAWYDQRIPEAWRMPKRSVCWVYDLRIPGMTSREQDSLVSDLNSQGIAARHAFKPVSSQLEYYNGDCQHHIAYRLAREVIYLPVNPSMSEADTERICSALSTATPHSPRELSLRFAEG